MRFAATPAVRFRCRRCKERCIMAGYAVLRHEFYGRFCQGSHWPFCICLWTGRKRRILVLTATDIWSLNSCTSELPCWAAMRLQPDTMHGLHTMNGADGCWKSRRTRRKTKVMCCIYTQEQLVLRRFFRWGLYRQGGSAEVGSRIRLVECRKHDSQDICFVPMAIMQRLMEQYTGKQYPHGDFVDRNGKEWQNG